MNPKPKTALTTQGETVVLATKPYTGDDGIQYVTCFCEMGMAVFRMLEDGTVEWTGRVLIDGTSLE